MQPDLSGVYEKLKRTDENIFNLDTEIGAFVKENPGSGVGEDKGKVFEKWVKSHANRSVPLRFSVLASEIVHHLQSSLDHVAWSFSSEAHRLTKDARYIGFPIFIKPLNKEERRSYDRKIKGITCSAALGIIEDLQPYKRAHPTYEMLAIIHNLDCFYKHRNLALVVANFRTSLKIPLAFFQQRAIGFMDEVGPEVAEPTQNPKMQISRQISFAEFGEWKNQPVVPSLTKLTNEVRSIVGRFAELHT